jgi:hypothetical protein
MSQSQMRCKIHKSITLSIHLAGFAATYSMIVGVPDHSQRADNRDALPGEGDETREK